MRRVLLFCTIFYSFILIQNNEMMRRSWERKIGKYIDKLFYRSQFGWISTAIFIKTGSIDMDVSGFSHRLGFKTIIFCRFINKELYYVYR